MMDFTPPRDVFPRRNLGAGEEWGREMEERVVDTENVLGSLSLVLRGENRTSASSLGEMSRQLKRLEDLYDSIPKVTQSTASFTGFGLGPGWQTAVTDTITVPDGANRVDVSLFGVLWMRATLAAQTLVQAKSRVIIAGIAGPQFNTSADAYDPGLGATNAPQFSRSFVVVPESTFQVSLQIEPADAAAFPYNAENYAVITSLCSFTG